MRLSREQFIEDAYRLIGKPFLHQGTDPDAGGIDCIHAPAYLLRLQGFELPFEMPRTYHQDSHNCKLIEETLETHLLRIPQERARKGDLYLFRPAVSMRHLAIRLTDTDPPILLHPSSEPRRGFPNGQVYEAPFSDKWLRPFRACFRFKFWADEVIP